MIRGKNKETTVTETQRHTMVFGFLRSWWRRISAYRKNKVLFVGATLAYTVQILLFVCLGVLVVHGINVYPGYYKIEAMRAQKGQAAFRDLCTGDERHSADYVDCETAASDSQRIVSVTALERTLMHLLSHIAIINWFVPSSQSIFGYVVLRTVDTISSWTVFILAAVALIVLYNYWSLQMGPVYYRNQMALYKALENSAYARPMEMQQLPLKKSA